MELGIIYQTAWVFKGEEIVNVAYKVSERGTMECVNLGNPTDIFEADFDQITERPIEEEVV